MKVHKAGEERERRLGSKIDAGFKGIEDKLETRAVRLEDRIDKQDGRIEKIGNWNKLISGFGAVGLAVASWLGLRN